MSGLSRSLTHVGLYVLLFAQPISGWLMTSAQGLQVSWFGFFQLPDLVHRNSELFETLKSTHDNLALALYLIVFLHAAAALKHHFVSKDDVLRRMLPFTEDRDRCIVDVPPPVRSRQWTHRRRRQSVM